MTTKSRIAERRFFPVTVSTGAPRLDLRRCRTEVISLRPQRSSRKRRLQLNLIKFGRRTIDCAPQALACVLHARIGRFTDYTCTSRRVVVFEDAVFQINERLVYQSFVEVDDLGVDETVVRCQLSTVY
jgi:hypothetical protein